MKNIKLILMVLPFVFIATVHAQLVFGIGAKTCGEMLSELEKNSSEHVRFAREHGYVSWMQGYISGLDTQQFISPDTLLYAVKKKCEEKPLLNVYIAVHEIYIGLHTQ